MRPPRRRASAPGPWRARALALGLAWGLAGAAPSAGAQPAPEAPPGPQAQEATDLLQALIRVRSPAIEAMAARPEIVQAVQAQNSWTLSEAEIRARDEAWQAAGGRTPLADKLQRNEAGRLLAALVERGSRSYTEGLLMDRRGALVAAYPPPSDYDQGDEEKFRRPFETGQLYIGPIHFDRSTRAYVSDVCAPVFGDAPDPIGALCMAVRLSKGPGIPPEAQHE